MRDALSPAELNQSAWSEPKTLRWFAGYEGFSDPGERSALAQVRDVCAGEPILDLGVGAGRTTPLLRAISADYIGIDFAQPMVDVCRGKYPDARIEWGDARDLTRFDDGTFGLVCFSWNGIDAVDHDDRARVLREVHRVLRPGGFFAFSTHNMRGPGFDEKPWTVRAPDLVHPRHLADLAVHFRRNLRSYRAHRPSCEVHDDWAMMTAAAHNFGIVIHYTTKEAAQRELLDAGFAPEPLVFESPRAWWFHFVATRE
jgi:SAM-dependent methyltransferase